MLKRAVGGKASMLQDVEARRRTEIDVINAATVEAGQRLGIPTPTNQTMVWLIKSLEETFEQELTPCPSLFVFSASPPMN